MLANAITSRIAPYINTLTIGSIGNQMRTFDENKNGLHNNLTSLALMDNNIRNNGTCHFSSTMNTNLNNTMDKVTNKLNNDHFESISSKPNHNKLESNKKDDEQLNFNHHLNNSMKSSNFNLFYPSSNFNLTSLLKN